MKFKINKGGELGIYYYQKDGVVYGPIKIDELLEKIDGNTMVYTDRTPWGKAKDNSDLKKYFLTSISDKNTAALASPTPNQPTNSKSNNKGVIILILLLIVGLIAYFINKNNGGSIEETPVTDSTSVVIDSSIILGEGDAVYQTLSKKYIDQKQLERIPYSDIINYQNELLARHGFNFEDNNVRNYYSTKPWYRAANNYLMATSGFSVIEKYNFDLLNTKNTEIKNKILDIINSYYNVLANQTFDANSYYAERVNKYITKSNTTPAEINELNRNELDFVNPKYQFIQPIEIKYERGADGYDYFYFRVFFGVYRPSKQKFQSCNINLKWGFDANYKIVSNQELSYDNLNFSDEDNFNSESPSGIIDGNTWIVILGSFQSESDANDLMERCNSSGLNTEVFSTNSFQYLAKDYFIVCSGRIFKKADAIVVAADYKSRGFENYIKNAGMMQ